LKVTRERRRQLIRLITLLAVVVAIGISWLIKRDRPAEPTTFIVEHWHFYAAIAAIIAIATELSFPSLKRLWLERRLRKRTQAFVHRESHARTLVQAWSTTLDAVSEAETNDLVRAFLATYADIESTAILGNTEGYKGRRHVITSFLAYSDFVRAVVATAKEKYAGRKIACFTTLPLPLPRWFNYRSSLGDASLKAISVDQRWESYKSGLHQLLDDNDIVFRRCVLAIDKAHPDLKTLAIDTWSQIERYARYSILVRHEGTPDDDVEWSGLRPHTLDELMTLVDTSRSTDVAQLREQLVDWYDGKTSFYVVHEAFHESLPKIPKYRWSELWRAFDGSAHRRPDECRLHCFNHEDARLWYRGKVEERVPEDIFAIGLRRDGKPPDWKFFFAGDVGKEIDRVTLEFVVAGEQKDNHRYERLAEFTDTVWDSPRLGVALEEKA
jgi:hypothetical protein